MNAEPLAAADPPAIAVPVSSAAPLQDVAASLRDNGEPRWAVVSPSAAEPSPAGESAVRGGSFGDMLAAALDRTAVALDRADGGAAAVAAGSGSIADASIARARADVALEIAAVAASRVSGALNTLLQTQT